MSNSLVSKVGFSWHENVIATKLHTEWIKSTRGNDSELSWPDDDVKWKRRERGEKENDEEDDMNDRKN